MNGTTEPRVTATLQYLSDDSFVNRRFVAPGAEINTGRYVPHEVLIRDARRAADPPTLDTHGFALARHPSAIPDFHDMDRVLADYPAEVEAAVLAITGADIVVPVGGKPTIRTSGDTSGGEVQPPANDVHVDTVPDRFATRADMLFAQLGRGGSYKRAIASSLWRPFSAPPQDWPLAMCDSRSLQPDEGVPNTLIYVDALPDAEAATAPIAGEDEMMAASVFRYRPEHRWYYYPAMTRDEVLFIKFCDTDRSTGWRAPHTAFRDPSAAANVPRESLEFRTVAFFL